MSKKIIIIAVVVITVLFGFFILRGSEDTWLCTEQGWIKHGNPSAPMPEYDCNQAKPVKEVVGWGAIKSVIINCEVDSVMQTHSLDVSVDLKDGRVLQAVEPEIDDIIDLAVEAQKKCGNIIIGTE